MLVLVDGVIKNMGLYYRNTENRIKGSCYNCEEFVPSRNYCKYYQKELNELTNRCCNK